jgi:hypothetical protein
MKINRFKKPPYLTQTVLRKPFNIGSTGVVHGELENICADIDASLDRAWEIVGGKPEAVAAAT